jgi:hypothetical protein
MVSLLRGGIAFRVIGSLLCLCVTLALGGCGDNESTTGPGTGDLYVVGFVTSVDVGVAMRSATPAVQTYAYVTVRKGTQVVADATVKVNNISLAYGAEMQGYSAVLPEVGSGDALSLVVTSSQGNANMSAAIPGPVVITAPASEASFADASDIPVTWNAAESAQRYWVVYTGSGSEEDYEQSTTSTSHTIPASATSVGSGTIYVHAVNGEGEWSDTETPTASGFWGMTYSWVDVTITN